MATMFSFYSRERSSSSPDLTTADGDTPKRQRSPQEQAQHVLRSKKLRLALESDFTDENIAEAMKEAPVWAKMLFTQMMNVNDEIASVRRQVDYLKLDMDNKIQTLVSNTEKINDEVKSLESKVETLAEEKTLLKRRVDKLTEDLDEMEQYSRRSCLIFAGIKETGDIPEDTDKAILDVCNNKLGLNLTQEAIDRSHRLGPVREARMEQGNEVNPSPRPIIVKFTNYHNRSMVFSSKRNLKGSPVSIMENLTARRVKLMQQAKALVGHKQVWSLDGRLFAVKEGKKIRIKREEDLKKLG